MTDLMYCGEVEVYTRAIDLLKKKFPDISIRDGSDDVHQYRFETNLPEDQTEKYFKFLLENQLSVYSLTFRLALMNSGGHATLIQHLIAEYNHAKIQSPVMKSIALCAKDVAWHNGVRNVIGKLFKRRNNNGK
jgi:hypothetical protein